MSARCSSPDVLLISQSGRCEYQRKFEFSVGVEYLSNTVNCIIRYNTKAHFGAAQPQHFGGYLW